MLSTIVSRLFPPHRHLKIWPPTFDVLLTVHLSIFISVINQLDAQNFCFTISLFHASTCFEQTCSKHVEAWNKLIVKQKFCASSWLITEINWPLRFGFNTGRRWHLATNLPDIITIIADYVTTKWHAIQIYFLTDPGLCQKWILTLASLFVWIFFSE